MAERHGFQCSSCGQWHDELPYAYHLPAPAHWSPELTDDESSELGEEQCVIRDEHFFVRGLIRIPVANSENDFEWGVWVSLSRDNFLRMADLWQTEGREAEEPYFGWLSNEIPVYSVSTAELKTKVYTQPVGLRPLIELEPTDHALAIEQREGINVQRIQQLAEFFLHGTA